jgi:plasmid stabilization system protein ParE
MALKHKWLKEANLELVSTLDYVESNFGERVVKKVYSDIFARIKQLQSFPNSGILYKDISYKGNEVRISHMKRSSIIYCYDDETLFILAFWNNLCDDSIIEYLLSSR